MKTKAERGLELRAPVCLMSAPRDQLLPESPGGIRNPEEGERNTTRRELLVPGCPTHCVASGRAVPSLDILLSAHLLEALCKEEMRRQEGPASFKAACFSFWPLLGILAEVFDS